MKNLLVRAIASVVALLVIVFVYWFTREPNLKHFDPATTPGIWADSPTAILIAVGALAVANTVIRPIILFFAWPINCLTFGLFSFVLNVVLFMLVGHLGFGFHVNGPIHALIGSVAMGFLSGLITFFTNDRGGKRKD